MAKESRLTFRVRSELKTDLEAIALREKRSVAQICELMLSADVEAYRREGSKYLQRLLLRPQK
jgi:hypothetical protein